MVWIRNFGWIVLSLVACAQHRAAAQTIDALLGDGRDRWVQFQIVDGRIQAESPYFGRFRSYSGNDKTQRLTIGTNMSGVGVIRYSWSDKDCDISAEASEAGEIKVTRSPKGDDQSKYRAFSQPTRGPVVLSFGAGDQRQDLRAASIWHLLLAHPKECHDHLYPLLDRMRDGWNWDQNVGNLRSELFRLAKARSAPDQTKWASLVKQLASDKFVERQRAERLLRGFGRAAVPYLQSLDRKQLDAEQQFRIKRIVLSSYGGSDDTPGRVATWLVADPNAWVSLLAEDDVEHRRLALAQLNLLVERPVVFDPNADARTREKQIADIRKKLAE